MKYTIIFRKAGLRVFFVLSFTILFKLNSYGQELFQMIPFTDWMGKSFPLEDVVTLNGDTLTQNYFIDKVCFFNFFAAGCPPCMQEIKYLNRLSAYYQDNKDVCILSFFSGSKEEYEKFYKSNEIKTKAGPNSSVQLNLSMVTVPQYPVIPVISGRFGFKYHAWGLPSNLIIDKQGIVRYCKVGFPRKSPDQEDLYSEYISEIDKLMIIPAP